MSFYRSPGSAGILFLIALCVVLFIAALIVPLHGTSGSQIADESLLMLRTGSFDPLVKEPPEVRIGSRRLSSTAIGQGAAAAQDEDACFIVQFNGAIRPEDAADVIARGYRIVGYLPNNAYIVRGRRSAAAGLKAMAGSGAYRWVGAYGAALKVDPQLARSADDAARGVAADDEVVALSVITFPGEDASQLGEAARGLDVEGAPIVEQRADERVWSVVRIARRDLPAAVSALAGIEGVEWIEPRTPRRLHNEIVVRAVQTGNASVETPLYARGLTGAGQIYGAADSGLDTDHAQFRLNNQSSAQTLSFAVSTTELTGGRFPFQITNEANKVLVYYLIGSGNFINNPENPHGGRTLDPNQRQGLGNRYRNSVAYDDSSGGYHGTATTSVAVGRHFVADGSGAVSGISSRTQYDGVAPDARVVFQDIGHVSGELPGVDLVSQILLHEQAYSSGVRVHNNSYGPDPPVGYDQDAADIDEIMWRLRDYSIFYSAGNDGVSPRQISNAAKNNVVVAATESPTTGGDIENLASFSSHGPTADGRIKPDIAAPGIVRAATEGTGQTASGFSSRTSTTARDAAINGVNPNNNQDLRTTSGTSFASPAVAGGALLVRQYFTDGFYPSGAKNSNDGFNPSNALVKAIILNSGRNMTGSNTASDGTGGARGSLPNFGQGWGRVALDDALYFSGDRRELKVLADIYNGATTSDSARPAPNPAIRTSETHTYTIESVSTVEPLRVTLVWSDPRALTSASVALVNNLDLEVIDPQGAVYRGNANFIDGYSQPAVIGGVDNRNPVEAVYIKYPQPGTYTVRVIGANVPGNGQMNVMAQPGGQSIDSNRQGYALIATGNFTAGAQPVIGLASAIVSGGVNSDRFIGRNETVTAQVTVDNPVSVLAQSVNVEIAVDAGSQIPANLVRINGGAPGAGATLNIGDIAGGTAKTAAFQVTLLDDGVIRAGQQITFRVVMTPAGGISFTTQFSLIAQQRIYVYRTRFEPTPDPGGGAAQGETVVVIPESAWGLRPDNPSPAPGDPLFSSAPWTLTTALKSGAGGSTTSLVDPSGVGPSYGVSLTPRGGGSIFDDTRYWTTSKIVLPGLNVSPVTGLVTNPELTSQLRAAVDSFDVDLKADFSGDTARGLDGDLFFLRLRTYRNTAPMNAPTDDGFNDLSFTNLLLVDSSRPPTNGFEHFGGNGFANGNGSFEVSTSNPNNSDVAFRLELQLRRNAFGQQGDGVAVDNLEVRLRIGDATVYQGLPQQTAASVDAASFVRAAAPGQIMAAFGGGLPADLNFTSSAGTLPLPVALGDFAVRVNGIAAPLFFVGASGGAFQINYQLPYETPIGMALVEIVRGGAVVAHEFLPVSEAAPGVFTLTSNGQGQAVALNQDFSLNGSEQAEARGRFIVVYATGQGAGLIDEATQQPAGVMSGAPAGGNPLIVTASVPAVTIGGAPATVAFSGLAPGFVGLWQLNILIPDGAPVGDAVPLVISFGGRESRATTIAVK